MASVLDPKELGSNGRGRKAIRREPAYAEYLTIFLRRKWTLLFSAFAITAAAAIYSFVAKPVYESSARVLIDMQVSKGSLPFSYDMGATTALNKMNDEVEILKSPSLQQAVTRSLMQKGTLVPGSNERIPIIETLTEDETQEVTAPEGLVMERLAKAVDFTPVKESDIIKISARSNDPREAALLANVYAETYVERNMTSSRARSRSVREFLQSQLDYKKRALDSTEVVLQRYMQTSGTVALDDETKKMVDQLAQLEASRDETDVEMSSRQKTLDSYKTDLARQEPAVASSIGESNDAYVRLLQEQLAKLEVQRDVVVAQNPALAGHKIYNDKLKEIDDQIASLKTKLQNRTSDLLKSVVPSSGSEGSAGYLADTRQKIVQQRIELEGLSARKAALNSVITDYENRFSRIPQKSIELAKLQRTRMSSEKLYLLVEEKYNEAAITEKSEFGYVEIIDPALVPIRPVSPKLLLNLIVGLLGGLSLGVVIAIMRERLIVRVRTPEDLKRFGFANVSVVNRMVEERGGENGGESSASPSARRTLDPHLVTLHMPLSSLAESYRALRTMVRFAVPEGSLKSVMVTSANSSEGKSTTAANLAISFAQSERKVLLVDADMRRPILHTLFNLRRRRHPGLVEYLSGSSMLDEIIQKEVLDSLDIICSGTIPPNPAEISGSNAMRAFIKLVSQMYDIVILDSAPLLAVTDASVLGSQVDGTILVVSSGETTATDIEGATEALGAVGGKLVGVLLNNFDPRKAYGSYYQYYRRKSYGDYIGSSRGDGSRKGRLIRN